jgi:proton-dependent oligopeptide transporter, POT family
MNRLFLLVFTQLWESFSFFGMRVLLVLYLVSELGYADSHAIALYALYTTLIELSALLGGYCGDRWLGPRRAVLLGGLQISLGHLLLTFSSDDLLFVGALGSIVCGASLFRTNLKAMVGQLYPDKSSGRDSGFTLLYTAINCGGFLAALLCGLVAEHYGWHAGFGLAAVGMLFGMALFLLLYPSESMLTDPVAFLWAIHWKKAIVAVITAVIVLGAALCYYQQVQRVALPITLTALIALLLHLRQQLAFRRWLSLAWMLVLLVVYFTFEELLGSILMLFVERRVDRVVLGISLPTASLAAINPLVIICLGPLLALYMKRRRIAPVISLALPFLLIGLAFLILHVAAAVEPVEALPVIFSFALIAMGELLLAPAVLSFCAEAAPPKAQGLTMGLVTAAFALANLLSGLISQQAIQEDGEIASELFIGIALASFTLFVGVILVKILCWSVDRQNVVN